jgi:hypothetical protein
MKIFIAAGKEYTTELRYEGVIIGAFSTRNKAEDAVREWAEKDGTVREGYQVMTTKLDKIRKAAQ